MDAMHAEPGITRANAGVPCLSAIARRHAISSLLIVVSLGACRLRFSSSTRSVLSAAWLCLRLPDKMSACQYASHDDLSQLRVEVWLQDFVAGVCSRTRLASKWVIGVNADILPPRPSLHLQLPLPWTCRPVARLRADRTGRVVVYPEDAS